MYSPRRQPLLTRKEWNLDPKTIRSTLAQSDKALNQIISSVRYQDRVLKSVLNRHLNSPLIAHAQSVVAVEIDRDLCQLTKQLVGMRIFTTPGDILSLNLADHLTRFPAFQSRIKLLPSPTTSRTNSRKTTRHDCPAPEQFECIVLLVQKK